MPEEPRPTLARLLRGSQSHAGVTQALAGFPVELAGRRVEGHPHSAWEQLEHLRLAAEDLVAYACDPEYAELPWPEGYWPASPEPPSAAAWQESVRRLEQAIEQMAALVEDPSRELYARVPSAEKAEHHLFRAALILLDHDGYHAGQLVALRRALGAWPPG